MYHKCYPQGLEEPPHLWWSTRRNNRSWRVLADVHRESQRAAIEEQFNHHWQRHEDIDSEGTAALAKATTSRIAKTAESNAIARWVLAAGEAQSSFRWWQGFFPSKAPTRRSQPETHGHEIQTTRGSISEEDPHGCARNKEVRGC